VAISIQTLANLTASSFIPDYIKVDVEGNELEAVRGLEVLPKLLLWEFNLPKFRDEFLSTVSLLVQIDQTVRFKILTEVNDGFLHAGKGEIDASALIEMVDVNQLKYFELFCFSDR